MVKLVQAKLCINNIEQHCEDGETRGSHTVYRSLGSIYINNIPAEIVFRPKYFSVVMRTKKSDIRI
jgi:hypothetical protein